MQLNFKLSIETTIVLITFLLQSKSYGSNYSIKTSERNWDSKIVWDVNQHPFVHHLITVGSSISTVCLGFFITQEFLLTTASCVGDASRMLVITGTMDMSDVIKELVGKVMENPEMLINMPTLDTGGFRILVVHWFYKHPKYKNNGKPSIYDIALVKLWHPANIPNDAILTLRTKPWSTLQPREESCTTVGALGESIITQKTLFSNLNVLYEDTECGCMKSFNFICSKASTEQKSFCHHGGGGGPLICYDNKVFGISIGRFDCKTYQIIGVHEQPECSDSVISMFTYICPHVAWINSYVGINASECLEPDAEVVEGKNLKPVPKKSNAPAVSNNQIAIILIPTLYVIKS